MPAEVPLFYSPLVVQRRKDLWGEDAEEFVPDRWIDPDRVKDLTADPFKFVPFNAGPRICPGQVCTLCFRSYVGNLQPVWTEFRLQPG